MLLFFTNVSGILGQLLVLILSFLSHKQFGVIPDWEFLQEYPVNAGVSQGSILGSAFFLLYINDLDDLICNITIYSDDTTLCSKCNQASDLCQQIKLAFELESDQGNTVAWSMKCSLLISMLEKLSLFCLTGPVTMV